MPRYAKFANFPLLFMKITNPLKIAIYAGYKRYLIYFKDNLEKDIKKKLFLNKI